MRLLPIVLTLCLAAAPSLAAERYVPRFVRAQNVAAPQPCALPDYPKASKRNDEYGAVTLRYSVDSSGKLVSVSVAKSSGFRDLDRAALRGFEKCRFSAATINGHAVQSGGLVRYNWELE